MDDLDEIMKIFAHARKFMAEHGNPSQWGTTRPSQEQIEKDIEQGISYVCDQDGEIEATFVFFIGEDPTYQKIEDGQWRNQDTYGVLHRVASRGRVRGISKDCIDFCKAHIGNLRGDTYKDNHVMQHVLEKNGFVPCGTIYVEDGSPRIAYQYVSEEHQK